MPDSWEMISSFIQLVALPLLGWVLLTMIGHSKQIILLEEKVNDALNRRMTSIEDKVVSLEVKIETKIDSLEESVVDCKLAINDKLNEKFDTLIAKLDK
jgi:hypothetical protein|tara:strand:- start:869 stop:1165 length:297 start_codon:yes stop_codon:yes gene_type:complete